MHWGLQMSHCQKRNRQDEPAGQVDEPAGQVDVPTRVEDGDPCDGGSRTCVGTTDVLPPVKNNTDRMNQLVR